MQILTINISTVRFGKVLVDGDGEKQKVNTKDFGKDGDKDRIFAYRIGEMDLVKSSAILCGLTADGYLLIGTDVLRFK